MISFSVGIPHRGLDVYFDDSDEPFEPQEFAAGTATRQLLDQLRTKIAEAVNETNRQLAEADGLSFYLRGIAVSMLETEYWECDTCCYAISGDPFRILTKLDIHERDNPGHRMKEADD